MHRHTFGKDRGMEVLTTILDEGPKQQRKHICAFIQKYIRELEQLQYVKDHQIKLWWLQRIYIFYKNELQHDKIVEAKVKDFANNTVVTLYRNKLRELEQRGYRGSDNKWHNNKRHNVELENARA